MVPKDRHNITIPVAIMATDGNITYAAGGNSEPRRSLLYTRGYLERGEGRASPDDPLVFVAATEGLKRDGLDLRMEGLDLDRFQANPVVLWAHNYWSPPIGRATSVHVDGARLLIEVVFDRTDPFAAAVEGKYRSGFLNAVSIGFDPTRVTDAEGNEVPWYEGGVVEAWELWELSAVPVPADPQALVDSGRAALRGLGRQLVEALDDLPASPPGALRAARNRTRLASARDLITEVLAEAEADDLDSEAAALAALSRLRDAFGRT